MRTFLTWTVLWVWVSLLPALAAVVPNRRLNFQSVASVTAYSPTNNGVQNLSWWIADGQTASADGILTNWLDSGVTPITLTNLGATTSMPRWTNAVLNGHAFARFDGADNNNSVNYTSSQPHEVVMVCRWWGAITGFRAFFSGRAATHNGLRLNTPVELTAGLTATVATAIKTNQWMVVDCLFNGTGSAFFTNNVSGGAVNSGTTGTSGFTMANYYNLSGGAFLDVAEVVTYSASLGAVDAAGTYSVATARSNLYVYLTNKYAITQ